MAGGAAITTSHGSGLLLAALAMSAMLAAAGPADAQTIPLLECRILDGATGQPRSVFRPEEWVRVYARLRLGEQAMTADIRLWGRLSVTMQGFTLQQPITLTPTAPAKATRDGIPGWPENERIIRDAYAEVDNDAILDQRFQLPRHIPSGRVRLDLFGLFGAPAAQKARCSQVFQVTQ